MKKQEKLGTDGHFWDRVVYINGNNVVIGYVSRQYLVETQTVETVNEEKVIGTMCALKNAPASTVNAKVKQILQKGTKVTIIEKMKFKTFGHIWYRVKLADGTQGYVSSEYFEKEPEAKYKIDGENIIIAPNTAITDIPKATLVGDLLGTGAKVKVEDKEYTLVVLGDVNGDGAINTGDTFLMKQIIMEVKKCDNECMKAAADINHDGKINTGDSFALKKHVMEVSNIKL